MLFIIAPNIIKHLPFTRLLLKNYIVLLRKIEEESSITAYYCCITKHQT